MKDRNFIIEITKFDAGYILNGLIIRVWGRLVMSPAYTKMIVTLLRRIFGLIGLSGFTIAKVDVPCVFKKLSGK